MQDDQTNQVIGAVSPDVEYVLVETSLGNGYLVAQLPSLTVRFHAFSAANGHEVEVRRHKVAPSPDELQQLQQLPPTHTLRLDPASRKIVMVPKTLPKKTDPSAN